MLVRVRMKSQSLKFQNHFAVPLYCNAVCGWSADELGGQSQQFFICVFPHIGNDLCLSESGVSVFGVSECAGDADFADCFELVCVADNVSNKGVIGCQDAVVIGRRSRLDGVVFRAVGYVLDDLFDFSVVADIFLAEFVKSLFQRAVFVVFVVGDIVQPGSGYGVKQQVVIMSSIRVVLFDEFFGCFCNCLHVFVSVRFVSVRTSCPNEASQQVPAFLECPCHFCILFLSVSAVIIKKNICNQFFSQLNISFR